MASPDYTSDPRLTKVPFMTLKRTITTKAPTEAKNEIFACSTKFSLAQVAVKYQIKELETLLDEQGSFEEAMAQVAAKTSASDDGPAAPPPARGGFLAELQARAAARRAD